MNGITIDDLQLNVDAWQVRDEMDRYRVWENPGGDLLSLSFSPTPITSQIGLSSSQKLQDFHRLYRRTIQQAGGNLISIDVVSVRGVSAIKTVFMLPQPNRKKTYVGSLAFPFQDFSYAIKIQCQECGGEERSLSHPLLRTRRYLAELAADLEFSPAVLQASPLPMLAPKASQSQRPRKVASQTENTKTLVLS